MPVKRQIMRSILSEKISRTRHTSEVGCVASVTTASSLFVMAVFPGNPSENSITAYDLSLGCEWSSLKTSEPPEWRGIGWSLLRQEQTTGRRSPASARIDGRTYAASGGPDFRWGGLRSGKLYASKEQRLRDLQSPPALSIVISTRDRLSKLKRCIEAALSVTAQRDWELIIVDNGSTDGTGAYFNSINQLQYNSAHVTTISEPRLGGVARQEQGLARRQCRNRRLHGR